MNAEKHITLTNDIQQINSLTSFIEECGEQFNLPADVVFNLTLAMEEMVSNVIMYAFADGVGHTFDVGVVRCPDRLIFTVTDDGIEFNPTVVPDIDVAVPAEERRIGGLGIFIARQIMDDISYRRENGKNILTLTKRI